MEDINCILCGENSNRFLFSKESDNGEIFSLVKCKDCGLQFISPRPLYKEMGKYYNNYFQKRSDRGYDNYFSEKIKNEIERVFKLNLEDLDFFSFEKTTEYKTALDIGSAAGYFVSYLKKREWNSIGIDTSDECVDIGKKYGINLIKGDYLKTDFEDKFSLITLWATIEHLHQPDFFLKKIYNDLTDHGILYMSTCRADGFNFMKLFGPKWRYYNFPQHLYFFSYKQLKKLLQNNGFEIIKYTTYGSGVGIGGSFKRKIADFMAKKFFMGDMMIISAKKLNK
jgi:SAM-dependent methyltransferase